MLSFARLSLEASAYEEVIHRRGAVIVRAEKESEIEINYRLNLTIGGKKREVKLTRRGRILEIEKKR